MEKAMRVGIATSFLFVIGLTSWALANDASSQIDANFKYVKDRLNNQEDYLIKVHGHVDKIADSKSSNQDAARQLLDLRKQLSDQTTEVKGMLAAMERLKSEAEAGQRKSSDETDALNKKLQELINRVDESGKAIKQRSDQLDKFKFQTRMKVYTRGRDLCAELESVEGNKIIPFDDAKLQISKQIKDGKLTALDSVVTDSRGMAAFQRPRVTSEDPRGTYIVFSFDGDELHRPCSERFKIR